MIKDVTPKTRWGKAKLAAANQAGLVILSAFGACLFTVGLSHFWHEGASPEAVALSAFWGLVFIVTFAFIHRSENARVK